MLTTQYQALGTGYPLSSLLGYQTKEQLQKMADRIDQNSDSMTVKELIDRLSPLDPDAEVVGGVWNGRVDTYTVFDEVHVYPYDQISADFYGTPGAFDEKLLHIHSQNVVYLGSLFGSLNDQVSADRRVMCRMERILRMHRSKEWKKEKVYQLLQDFADEKVGDYIE